MKIELDLDVKLMEKLIAEHYAAILYEKAHRGWPYRSEKAGKAIEERAVELLKELPEVDEQIKALLMDEDMRKRIVEGIIREKVEDALHKDECSDE